MRTNGHRHGPGPLEYRRDKRYLLGCFSSIDRYTDCSVNPMDGDKQPEKTVNIQSIVNVGTATDQTTVSGAKVSVGSAREIHVHGDTNPPPSFRGVALVGVLAFLGAVLITANCRRASNRTCGRLGRWLS